MHYRVMLRERYPAREHWTRWAKADDIYDKLQAYEYPDITVLVHPGSGLVWQVGFEWEIVLVDGTRQHYRLLTRSGDRPHYEASQRDRLLHFQRAWGKIWPKLHEDAGADSVPGEE